MNLRRRWAGYWFLLPYLTLFSVFTLGPLLFGLALSFMQYDLARAEPAKFAGVSNYTEALASEDFRRSLGATVKFVVLSVPITIPLALLLAIAIDASRTTRQAVYRIGVFAPTVITISVVGLIWRWFYNRDFGLFNGVIDRFGHSLQRQPAERLNDWWFSKVNNEWLDWIHGVLGFVASMIDWFTPPVGRWLVLIGPVHFLDTPNAAMISLVVMTLWWTMGGPVLVLLAGLKQIPEHYYEAAEIDGAVGWRAFWNITLPLLKPALLFTLVINVIGAFQVFGQPFMVTNGGPERSTRVAMQYIYETAFRNYRLGYGSAMSWLLFLVIAVFAVIQFRLMRDDEDDATVRVAGAQRRPTR